MPPLIGPAVPERPAPQDAGIERVGTIELLFDLVLVFAATQITGLIGHPHGPADYLKAALVFLSLMWIYDGYVWLTSNVVIQERRDRWLFFVAMAGFFVMALGIPSVFGPGGLPYALGLLLVTVIHTALFGRVANSSAAAIRGVAPYNLGSAGLVLLAAFVPEPWRWPLWLGALGVLVAASLRRSGGGFSLSPRHFVERHGLLMIIALGESVVALGLGARELSLGPAVLAFAVLGVFLAVGLWWTYFEEDQERAEHLLSAAPAGQRGGMALWGFGFGHSMMIFGIILIAAALEVDIARPTGSAGWFSALNLAAGLGLYLLGNVAYRRVVGIRHNALRLGLAALAVLSIFVGLNASSLLHLLVCVLLLLALWGLEGRRTGQSRSAPATP